MGRHTSSKLKRQFDSTHFFLLTYRIYRNFLQIQDNTGEFFENRKYRKYRTSAKPAPDFQITRDSVGEMHMYSLKYRKINWEKNRLKPKSNERWRHFRHQTSHRSQRLGWSLWRSSLDPCRFGVYCWIRIADKRDTRSLMRRGCNIQWSEYRSESRTTSQWSHPPRTESLDSNFFTDYVPIGLGLEWCWGMIDIFGCCMWRLPLSR